MDVYFSDIKTPCGATCDLVLSALQKFIRRGDVENAVRAAFELYMTEGELHDYLWKRLLVISAEDIGLAQPMAPVVVGALNTIRKEIPPESSDYPMLFVAAIRYLCQCPKDQGASNLASVMKRRIKRGDAWELPDYVYDMHTAKGQEMGRGYLHFLREASKTVPEGDVTLNPWKLELTQMMEETEHE